MRILQLAIDRVLGLSATITIDWQHIENPHHDVENLWARPNGPLPANHGQSCKIVRPFNTRPSGAMPTSSAHSQTFSSMS
jgi:hypothetical protein